MRGLDKSPQSLATRAIAVFSRLPKTAQKRLWPHKWPQTEKSLFFPLAVVSWQKNEYPGVAQLVGRDIWDVEVGCSSHLTRTKISLKSTISERFSYSLSIAAQAVSLSFLTCLFDKHRLNIVFFAEVQYNIIKSSWTTKADARLYFYMVSLFYCASQALYFVIFQWRVRKR